MCKQFEFLFPAVKEQAYVKGNPKKGVGRGKLFLGWVKKVVHLYCSGYPTLTGFHNHNYIHTYLYVTRSQAYMLVVKSIYRKPLNLYLSGFDAYLR